MSSQKKTSYKKIFALLGGLLLVGEAEFIFQDRLNVQARNTSLSKTKDLAEERNRVLQVLEKIPQSFLNEEEKWIQTFEQKAKELNIENVRRRKEFREQWQQPRYRLEKWNDLKNQEKELSQAREEFLWKMREQILEKLEKDSPEKYAKVQKVLSKSDFYRIKRLSEIMAAKLNNVFGNSEVDANQVFQSILEKERESTRKGYWYRIAKQVTCEWMAHSWKYGESVSSGQLNWMALERRLMELKHQERRKRCAIETFISAAVLTDKQKELAAYIVDYPGDFSKLIYHDAGARGEIMHLLGYVKINAKQPFQCGDVERFSYYGKTPKWAGFFGQTFLPDFLLHSNSHRRILYNGLCFSDGLEGPLLKENLMLDPLSSSLREDRLRSFDYERWRPNPEVYGRRFSSHAPSLKTSFHQENKKER